MFERERLTPGQEQELEKSFDEAKAWWQTAVNEGRAQKTEFYSQVFEQPESEIYRERCDREFLLHVAKTMNNSWVGLEYLTRKGQ